MSHQQSVIDGSIYEIEGEIRIKTLIKFAAFLAPSSACSKTRSRFRGNRTGDRESPLKSL